MDLDLLLAIAHHLAVFTLVALFAAEFTLVRPGLRLTQLPALARIDAAYGATAALVIVVGILRVTLAVKGWDYYATNSAFWGKMAAFLVMGLLTVPPSLAIRRWLKAAAGVADYTIPAADIALSRRFVHGQALALLFIPVFAAAMARGYGS